MVETLVRDAWQWINGRPCVPLRDNSGSVVVLRCGGSVREYRFSDAGDAARFERAFIAEARRAAA